MKQIIYCSANKTYKNPFGALPTDKECEFSIDILKSVNPEDVLFIYRQDGSSDSFYNQMRKASENENYIRYSVKLSFSECGLYFYRFEFSSNGEKRYSGKSNGEAMVGEWLSEWTLTVYDKAFKTPDWAKGSVMYQIFPDRFFRSEYYMHKEAKNNRKIHKNWFDFPESVYDNPEYKGNDFFMGNIKGIISRLEYIKSLGVSIIYLNPIFESSENHRYSTGDYKNVDPYLGTNEDFTELCRECEKLNMRVILDGVFSHTGADSIYFDKYGHYNQGGAYNNEDSPYYKWYTFNDSKIGYNCWWGFETLPEVNETEPSYLNFITGEDGVLPFWQKKGARGWRLDVADELPDEFLDALRCRVKETDPDALIIGEVWENAAEKASYGKRRRYLLGKQLDSVMNYPWRNAIIDFVKSEGKEDGAKKFISSVTEILESYPKPSIDCLMNVLSTHDTERIINALGVNKKVEMKDASRYKLTEEEYKKGKHRYMLASVIQFSLPGIPCIYYGDEAGLCGFRDPYSRMCYPYGKEDVELIEFIRKLGKVREKYKHEFIKDCSYTQIGENSVLIKRGNLSFVINAGNFDENIKLGSNIVTILGTQNIEIQKNNVKIKGKSFFIYYEKTA